MRTSVNYQRSSSENGATVQCISALKAADPITDLKLDSTCCIQLIIHRHQLCMDQSSWATLMRNWASLQHLCRHSHCTMHNFDMWCWCSARLAGTDCSLCHGPCTAVTSCVNLTTECHSRLLKPEPTVVQCSRTYVLVDSLHAARRLLGLGCILSTIFTTYKCTQLAVLFPFTYNACSTCVISRTCTC
jgi:hypothetical protein